MNDDEIVKCLQCDWPIRRGEGWSWVLESGSMEPIGVAHLAICVIDLAYHEPRAATQKRRAGMLRMN